MTRHAKGNNTFAKTECNSSSQNVSQQWCNTPSSLINMLISPEIWREEESFLISMKNGCSVTHWSRLIIHPVSLYYSTGIGLVMVEKMSWIMLMINTKTHSHRAHNCLLLLCHFSNDLFYFSPHRIILSDKCSTAPVVDYMSLLLYQNTYQSCEDQDSRIWNWSSVQSLYKLEHENI